MSRIRIFSSAIIRQQLLPAELDALVQDFRAYKADGVLPDTFGRDAVYNHANGLPIVKAVALRHLHLADGQAPWPAGKRMYERTSDVHLVYCQGFYDTDRYLLMTILSPDAHAQARDNSIMYKLGRMAEQFRDKH